jgi:hypothetical protein
MSKGKKQKLLNIKKKQIPRPLEENSSKLHNFLKVA